MTPNIIQLTNDNEVEYVKPQQYIKPSKLAGLNPRRWACPIYVTMVVAGIMDRWVLIGLSKRGKTKPSGVSK